MKRFRCLLLLATLPLAVFGASSDPVGALRLKLRGGSDTLVSLPLHRPALLEAAVSSRNANQLALDRALPSLGSSDAYALVMSGALEGAALPVSSGADSTVEVDAGTYDLSRLNAGDLVSIIPYWTLDTVFPAGASIHATTSLLDVKTRVLMFSNAGIGTYRSASAAYFYFSGDGSFPAGWYRSGYLSATQGFTRLEPNTYFIVRHSVGAADTELLVTGAVQMAASRVAIATRASNRDQDNFVASPVPLPVSLGDSSLVASGAFTATTNLLGVQDRLLVFSNNVTGMNKAASAAYFYFAGDGFYPMGWYRFDDMTQNANSVLLNPGEGYIVRKSGTAVPESKSWSLLPSYLQ